MSHVVSVIIPARNEQEFILLCIASVFACGYPRSETEVIVVDNNSSDATVSLVRSNFPEARVVHSDAGTIAGVRMDGYKEAKGEIVAFLDADSLVGEGWLAKGVEILGSRTDVSCVGFAPAPPDASSSWVEKTWHHIGSGAKWRNMQEVTWLSSFNLLIKRSFFEAVGGFDVRLVTCEDADLGTRLDAISKLLFCDEVTVRHLGNVKTVRGFFLKELWRGQSNFKQFIGSGDKGKHYKSVFAPILYTADVVLFISLLLFTSLFDLHCGWLCLLTGAGIVFLPLLLSIRARIRGGLRILETSFLYSIYLLARGVSVAWS